MRSGQVLLATILSVTILSSCNRNKCRDLVQGEIHYDVSFMGHISRMPKEILPKSLVVSFKNNKILYELLSPFGNSGIITLANPAKDIYDTYISMFTLKYFYPSQPGEIYPGFESMKGINIRKTSKTSIICGFECKHAEVTLPFDRSKKFQIWYTTEIPVSKPNASTPFQEIEGVLMNFFFIIGSSEFHFEVQNVYKKEIPDKAFERREKFKRVSKKDINKFIDKIVSF